MHPIHTALAAIWPALLDLADDIADEDWSSPSVLPGWTVADLFAHLGHVEGMVHGFPQPDTPHDFAFEGAPLHIVTNSGVAARRAWSRAEVVDELRRAVSATLEQLAGLDEAGWQAPALSPIGPTTFEQAMELRNGDACAHLFDLLVSTDQYQEHRRVPESEAALVARAVRLSPWAAVKRAGLADGTRVRLDLSGPAGVAADLVVEGGRGRLEEARGEPDAVISGPGIAYALRAGGRRHPAELVSALEVAGEPAERLLETYRLFG
ncbi:MAG: maleylpyruvate isomerase N-terminal domain-containing protein [Acidimicrobiia bacterium]|jgi:uncharacterized protein (TIGR03083 family)